MSAIPTGTVSFLFTDVEGSTRLWDADRAAMAASLAVHDRILREAAATHDGYIFSTAGDAFSIAFESADAAVDAAVEAQVALSEVEWPGPTMAVRMGIHTGTADERDGDYFGPTLNRTARLMSAGHGGQVLVSEVTRRLLTRISTKDLGSHRLKDLAEPEHVHEVLLPGRMPDSRPLRTADTGQHNLPAPLTSFVGRSKELADITASLAEHRLVVLTGVGGTGKTRLAVEAARAAAGDRAGGAWLAELAPITDPDAVMSTIGNLWGLRPGEGTRIGEVVLGHLHDQELLLVVDNCEHLLEGAAAAVRSILEHAPGVTVLATSRESLGVPGEHTIPVPSLTIDPHDPSHSDAVALFTERVRAVRPDFDPRGDEMDAVVRLCRRIDGIPLGLELAAARLRTMSSVDLADRLDDSFRILSGSAKTALPRQRTLQATIDWSHDLLDDAERAVFRRAAMFAGGFNLEGAEAVCSGDGVEDWEVLDHVDSLVDKSLLLVAHGEHARFRMLEPIRQYAQEQLQRSGESAAVLAAHADHFRRFVATAAPHTRGPDQMEWDRRLDADLENIRIALRTLLEAGDAEAHLAMAFDLYQYWMHVSLHVEAMDTLHAGIALAPEDIDPEVVIKAYFVIGVLGAEITDPKAVAPAERGLALAEEVGDDGLAARAHLAVGAAIVHSRGGHDGHRHMLEGQALLDANPGARWWEPEWEEAHLRFLLSAYLPADEPRKQHHADFAIRDFERLGDRAMLAASLIETFTIVRGTREYAPEAAENIRRALSIIDEIHLPYWAGHAHKHLAWTLGQLGRWDEAAAHYRASLDPLEDAGDLSCWLNARGNLVTAERELGDLDGAGVRLLQIIDDLHLVAFESFAVGQAIGSAAMLIDRRGDQPASLPLIAWLLASEDPELADWGTLALETVGDANLSDPPALSTAEALRLAQEALVTSL